MKFKKQTHKLNNLVIITLVILITSCNKILEKKSDKSMVVPETIADYQALLDYTTKMNGLGPTLGEISADNYYLPDATFDGLKNDAKNAYIWGTENYNGPWNDWAKVYDEVYYCNLALEGIAINNRNKTNEAAWNNLKGSSLFIRAQAFLQGAFIFCKAYNAKTGDKDLGMAIRLTADFNQKSTRATLKATYTQIINDLKTAVSLLPITPLTPYRPSKPAAYALLARTYLSMGQYDKAGNYADSCLKLKNKLIDLNNIDLAGYSPFSATNEEVIFQLHATNYSTISASKTRVDTTLYRSYDDNDLRKQAYFYPASPGLRFKGNYTGVRNYFFTGIAIDEIYLIRAESFARTGKTKLALLDLNTLLKNRWKIESFTAISTEDPEKLLNIILTERRKELLFRNLRWMDIKRLNIEGANIGLKRIVHGRTYILSPNDNRFAYPLPTDVIERSGMPQNPQ